MKRLSVLVALALMPLLPLVPAQAQGPVAGLGPEIATKPVEFEVATIKPYRADSDSGRVFVGGSCHGVDKQYSPGSIAPPPLGRCVLKRVSLTALLAIAYKAPVAGGPGWTSSEYYDVEGKADDPSTVTEAQLLAMLQTLVVTRFNVKFHRELREIQAFSLLVAKRGPKFKESMAGSEVSPRVQFGPGAKCTAQNVTMEYFANSIRGMAHGPVIDKTGLTGRYDFAFEWLPDDPSSFLSEMQVALGIRAEPTKQPADFLVIDHAEKPAQQ